MYFQFKRNHKLGNTGLTIFFLSLTCYFSYHALSGERGMLALIQLTQKVDKLENELDIVRAERLHIEHKVMLMRPDSIDLDLVDEQARRSLGYASKDEIVIFTDKTSNN